MWKTPRAEFLDKINIAKFAAENAAQPDLEQRNKAGESSRNLKRPAIYREEPSIRGWGRSFRKVLVNQSGSSGVQNEGRGVSKQLIIEVPEATDAFNTFHLKSLIGRAKDLRSLNSLRLLVKESGSGSGAVLHNPSTDEVEATFHLGEAISAKLQDYSQLVLESIREEGSNGVL
ncbi:hypothetical protein L1987_54521 [Smallanthus sonchifolius]|uniref:Uncharacterized protein n=1 Tax=Smallanthus sonchifolius TaxID=185202 RepID=A0ACB9E7D8_9ASTR|nr:hypothetical protein L1987_54521 [Smallanthus sonchifolius]